MQRIRLLPLVAAILFFLAGASDARAGQYTLSYDLASDMSGWGGYVEPGYNLCGGGSAAGCPDVTTLRIMARAGGAQAIWSQGRWEWTAPPGTTIVGGALAYRTRMRHSNFFARVKMRSGGDWADAPTLLAEQQTIGLTDHVIALASGFRQVGISLYAHPAAAGLITDAWDDYVTLVHLDVTVADATTPGVAWVDGEEPHRRPLASRRRLRHRRRRRQRVGSRERLACQRRDLDRLVRSAHRLAVSAGAALGSGPALPVCSGARRRHPPWRRRRRRCER